MNDEWRRCRYPLIAFIWWWHPLCVWSSSSLAISMKNVSFERMPVWTHEKHDLRQTAQRWSVIIWTSRFFFSYFQPFHSFWSVGRHRRNVVFFLLRFKQFVFLFRYRLETNREMSFTLSIAFELVRHRTEASHSIVKRFFSHQITCYLISVLILITFQMEKKKFACSYVWKMTPGVL